MAEAPIILSFLDRLIDADLNDRGYRLRGSASSVTAHQAAVKRDLEWLLNTRRIPDEAPEHLGLTSLRVHDSRHGSSSGRLRATPSATVGSRAVGELVHHLGEPRPRDALA